MNELLIQFTISLGKLLDRIKSAKNPKGDKGEAITSAEKKEIFDAFHEFENKYSEASRNSSEEGGAMPPSYADGRIKLRWIHTQTENG